MSVQRRNQLLALSAGLTGILAASGYILYYQSQKQEAARLEAARRPLPLPSFTPRTGRASVQTRRLERDLLP